MSYLLSAGSLAAQTPDRMFDELNVRHLVEKEVIEDQPAEYRFFPKVKKPVAEEPEKNQPPKKREDILMAYGNPNERHPVLAVDDAPAPFKGMQAALEAGEKELAYDYARQWVRYMGDIQERNRDIMKLLSHGMRSEGLSTPGDWTSSPRFIDPDLLRFENSEADRRFNQIDDYGRNFSPNLSLREELKGKDVIPDPRGEVDIYYFFDPADPSSLQMAAEVDRIHRTYERNKKINVVAMSSRPISKNEMEKIKMERRLELPINPNGEILARSLGLDVMPATVFMPRNGSPAVFEEGRRSFDYLRELTEMLRGN